MNIRILSPFLDLVFPRNCLLCKTYDETTANNPLCRSCQAKIPYNHPPFCVRCSRHLRVYNAEGLCPDCLAIMPAFDWGWGLTRYEPPMRELVHSFKFHSKTSLKKTFRDIMINFFDRYGITFQGHDLLVPAPLHPVRQRERGYNQAQLIAETLSELLAIPCLNDQLIRARYAPPQSDLGRKERWTNIKGAFKIKNPLSIKTKSVILVDDLLTTGSTASEAARTLKDAGVSRVGVIALCVA